MRASTMSPKRSVANAALRRTVVGVGASLALGSALFVGCGAEDPGTGDDQNATSTSSLTSGWQTSAGKSLDGANPRFSFKLTGSTALRIDLSSSADNYLYLLDANNRTLGEDDNSGGGTNARISATLGAGTYKIVAATKPANANGDFTLQTSLPSGTVGRCFFA